MKLKNLTRRTMWLKGVELPPYETRDVPGITLPEIKATELRTRVEIVRDKKTTKDNSSSKSKPKRAPEKAKVKTSPEVKSDPNLPKGKLGAGTEGSSRTGSSKDEPRVIENTKMPNTILRLHDDEEPKVMGELTEEGEVKMYDKPKSVEEEKK